MAERQFGPYRLVHQIAVGGMAEVYLAKARGFGGFEKYVALKMIHPNFSSDEHFIQMLVDEAKITVQLQHVNIVQVFDLGRVGETYYLTMEFIDGCDLYKVLRRASEQDRQMGIEVAAYIAKEVCAGLDYAHRKRDDMGRELSIVHRDVSPQNVLISSSAEVKITDFGIAKATMRARQTAAGVIKGKYYYMSPEQAWGDPLDHRTDIFSAGILLHEMLAGQMLYLEEDMQRLLDLVRKADVPPPSALRPDCPPDLEAIALKALARRPEDRWQSAHDFGMALERFLHQHAPDFTTSRLATFVAQVLSDAPPPAAPTPAPRPARVPAPMPERRSGPVDAGRVTKGMGRDAIMSRAEFTDENSVIFRVADLLAGGAREDADEPPPRARPRAGARAASRPSPGPAAGGAPARGAASRRMADVATPHVPLREDRTTPTASRDELLTPDDDDDDDLDTSPLRSRAALLTPGPGDVAPAARPAAAPRDGSPARRAVDASREAVLSGEATVISGPPGFGGDRDLTPRPGTAGELYGGAAGVPGGTIELDPSDLAPGAAEPDTSPGLQAGAGDATAERGLADDDLEGAETPPPVARVARAGGAGGPARVPLPGIPAGASASAPAGARPAARSAPSASPRPGARPSAGAPSRGPGPRPAAASPQAATIGDDEPTRMDVGIPTPTPARAAPDAELPVVPRDPRASLPPALSARSPLPAISALAPPRRSRRTPHAGVPAARIPGVGQPVTLDEPPTTRRPSGGHAGAAPPPASPLAVQPTGPPPASPLAVQPTGPPPPPRPSAPFAAVAAAGAAPAAPGTGASPVGAPPAVTPSGLGLPLAAPTLSSPAIPAVRPPWEMSAGLGAPDAAIGLGSEEAAAYRIGGRGSRRWMTFAIASALAGVLVIAAFVVAGSGGAARQPASLEIISIPPGATVLLDGRPAGVTPLLLERLDSRRAYRLRVELAKHEAWEREEPMPESGRRVKVIAALKPIVGILHVESNPPGAEVFLGNVSLGRTPLERSNLDPSQDGMVEVRLRGYRPDRQALAWQGRREVWLKFTLQPSR